MSPSLKIASELGFDLGSHSPVSEHLTAFPPTMARLVTAVQELSQARSIEAIREIVRHAARELTGADGATFVLRDGDRCHYVDEDAIAPLWKGQRFPMETCVSGWAMLHGEPVAIEDIFKDPRIPVDAYRKTFVRSLVMVPIRPGNAIGAIGNYWSTHYRASSQEVQILQALASVTAVAMENVRIYSELEQRVRQRTMQLEHANEELESFAGSVSHDLRAPLSVIGGYADLLRMTCGHKIGEKERNYLEQIPTQITRMTGLIDDLLRLARVRGTELQLDYVNLGDLAGKIVETLSAAEPDRPVEFVAEPMPAGLGDAALLRLALENLLSNAWKYTRKTARPKVTFGRQMMSDGVDVFFVRDNGAGFKMAEAAKLFTPFQRLHAAAEYPGTGVGLTIVARVIEKHGGQVWAEAEPEVGATFYFTLSAVRENLGSAI